MNNVYNISSKKVITLLVLTGVNILLMAVLAVMAPEFRKFVIYSYLLQRMTEAMILAIGVTIVFISRNIDISFGNSK